LFELKNSYNLGLIETCTGKAHKNNDQIQVEFLNVNLTNN